MDSRLAGAAVGGGDPPRRPLLFGCKNLAEPQGQGGGAKAWGPVNPSFGVWTDS